MSAFASRSFARTFWRVGYVFNSMSAAPRRRGAPELIEVDLDRLVGAQKLGQHVLARAIGALARAAILEKRPQRLADVRRKHPFQILEGGAAERFVIRIQAAKSNRQR